MHTVTNTMSSFQTVLMHLQAIFIVTCKSSVTTCHLTDTDRTNDTYTGNVYHLAEVNIYHKNYKKTATNQSIQSKATLYTKICGCINNHNKKCTNTKAPYQITFADNYKKHQHFIKILGIRFQNQLQQ